MVGHPGALPGGAWAVSVSDRGWPLLFAGVTAIAWLFPNGRLPSPRWRPWALVAAASFAVLTACALLETARFGGAFAGVASPLPELPESAIGVPHALGWLGALGGMLGAVAAVATRLRRSSGIERQQLRWLAYAAALIPAALAACVVEVAVSGREGPITFAALVVALTAVPAAIGIAILRYRLYEIDRLINRTLVYAGLSAALAATFAAISLGSGSRSAPARRCRPRRRRWPLPCSSDRCAPGSSCWSTGASIARATRACGRSSATSSNCARAVRRRKRPARCWPRRSEIPGWSCASGSPATSTSIRLAESWTLTSGPTARARRCAGAASRWRR